MSNTRSRRGLKLSRPGHNPDGDFNLSNDRVVLTGGQRLTFSGIGFYSPEVFRGRRDRMFSFIPRVRELVKAGRISGMKYQGQWLDIGTPERLKELEEQLNQSK